MGGLPELIEDGVHGLLFEHRDTSGLASALEQLLHDQTRREQMGERARERQRREFDLDSTVRRLEELYEDLYLHTKRARNEGWLPLPRAAAAPA